jgi:hypothetical protein
MSNKQLEKLFNLDSAESFEQLDQMPKGVESTMVPDIAAPIEQRIDQALPQVRGIGEGDGEVDNIAEEAMKTYQEIKDLAMNVEPRHSAELLAVAAQLLKTALDAKQGKTRDKLAAVRLQISAMTASRNKETDASVTETNGKIVGDRNQIIAALKNSENPAK